MAAEFETKKISIETLGEYLSSVRAHLNLPLEDVAQKTGIFEKFIVYLEEGKYHKLPPDVYVLGFLKKLADLYHISCSDIVTQFKKEKGIVEQTAREKIVPLTGIKSLLANISITPKLVTFGGGAVLGLGAFLYIMFQVFSVNRTPNLVVTEPQSGTVIKGSSVVVKGKTDPGMSVAVNGQNVFVVADGSFETTLSVAPGQKEFRVISENKFGKNSEEVVSLRIEDAQVAGAVTQQPSQLVLELQFTRAATIVVQQDGQKLPEETVPSGATKKITADDSITITTSDAGNTKATLNGQNLGALGKAGQELSVPFNKESQSFMSDQVGEETATSANSVNKN